MILELIAIIAIVLCLIFFIIQWNSKRELKKLRRNYNEQDNKSRRGEPDKVIGAGKPIIEERIDTVEVGGSYKQPEIIQPRSIVEYPITPSGNPAIPGRIKKDKVRDKPINRRPKLKRI